MNVARLAGHALGSAGVGVQFRGVDADQSHPLVAATDLDVDRVTVDHRPTTPTSGGNDAASSLVAPGERTTTATARRRHDEVWFTVLPDATPDCEQIVDRLVEVVVDGDVGDPLDVESGARPDLQVTLTVVGRLESPAVPGEVVDLDEESVRRDAEIGVHGDSR